jgi:hypothetical protein
MVMRVDNGNGRFDYEFVTSFESLACHLLVILRRVRLVPYQREHSQSSAKRLNALTDLLVTNLLRERNSLAMKCKKVSFGDQGANVASTVAPKTMAKMSIHVNNRRARSDQARVPP